MSASAARRAPTGREAAVRRQGLAAFADLLPTDWTVEKARPITGDRAVPAEAVVAVREPMGAAATLVVAARVRLAPRDVATVVGETSPLVRRLAANPSVLVLAPWLSPRTRDLLAEQGLGYLDLTGNALLRLDRPALFIRTAGAAQDPSPVPRAALSLRGSAAGRVVRVLADVRPPYTASAIAQASGVSIPYVSRLLTKLDKEALVERGARGLVTDVDWANLLRRRAETYDMFGTNIAQGFIARRGARDLAKRLPEIPAAYCAATGSFVASQLAPVAAPALLTLYVADMRRAAEALELLPADVGANVVLLEPYDSVVLDRAQTVNGLTTVAPSQLALDCLTGNGRMPSEGEALLDWMRDTEDEWRRTDITCIEPAIG